ncbi:hypothetical protein BJD60_gp34 [Gordonia phage Schnabeltier]|uniref:Ribbon-helix-helix protein CopG domain-containing protein n=1 Tax=Gordonia phage Schnabeltier TaxID=1821561 RepID=A0A142KA22_9CAUD|nr:hypothetical protein BJD60_gp34 [Gordonia phage Schnabeltier]AMS02955.1 hypothetical protein SEA_SCHNABELTIER_34 [Gordonia phage Schnabeltier]
MARLTDEDYAAMAADYAENPPTAEEIVGEVVVDPAILRTGRPPKSAGGPGKTPTMSVRLPLELRAQVDDIAEAEDVKPAEIIRRAVSEYVERKTPPAGARYPRARTKSVTRSGHSSGRGDAGPQNRTMAKDDVSTFFDPDSGKWKNKVQGNERASHTHDTRKDAAEKGAAMARDRKSEHTVFNRGDGRISKKDSYGNDPHPPKG